MIKASLFYVVVIALLGAHTTIAQNNNHGDENHLRRVLKREDNKVDDKDRIGRGGGGRGGKDEDKDVEDGSRKDRRNETALGIELDSGSEDGSLKGPGNETDLGDEGALKDKSRKGPKGRKHDFSGHVGGKKSRDFGGMANATARGPFGIEYAVMDCAVENSTEAECFGRRGEPGAWICRTLFDVVTGKPYSFSACIDVDESIGASNDVCGCCGECPTECSCPCDDGDGKKGDVKVLDAENPDDGGHCVNPKMAKRLVSNAGLLGPRHVCDVSCK